MENSARSLLVIVPAFNEEKSLPTVIEDLGKILTHAQDDGIVSHGKILVVDDGSTDATYSVAKGLNVTTLNLKSNLGIGGAVQTGYLYAEKYHYHYAIQVDGDGQHKAQDIVQLLSEISRDKYDMVIGSRYLQVKGFKSTFMRRTGKHIISALIFLRFRIRITDPTSGFRIVNRRLIEIFSHQYPVDYPEPESLALCLKSGFSIKEIPVEMASRSHGKTSLNVFKSIHYMIKVSMSFMVGTKGYLHGR